jgi:hypothetical protein
MIRRRGEAPLEESSSDEEDAFSEMTRKNVKRSKTDSTKPSSNGVGGFKKVLPKPQKLPVVLTSSMKRHYNPSDTRKAKMDALLQELEAEKNKIPREQHKFVPEKKGSFVEASEEHLTTNIFVGNLAPAVTE